MTHVGQEPTLRPIRFLGSILGLTQRILGALPLDHAPELSTDIGHDLQQRLIRLKCLTREELEDGDNITSDQNWKTETGPDVGSRGCICAGKIRVLGGVDDPRWLAGG